MGAESSILEEITFDDPLSTHTGSIEYDWLVYPAMKEDGSKLTVFVREKDKKGDIERFKNAGKCLKLLRHPSILKFLGCVDTNESLYLLTEDVLPLEFVIEDLTAQEISAGLYSIVEAMSFLHEQGGMCHNNLCMASIFVCPDGSWKLGGMEYLCKFEQATPAFLKDCIEDRNATALSPEEMDGSYKVMKGLGHARDAYALGVLAELLLENMSSLGDMCKTFELRIQDEFLNDDPPQRPQIGSLVEDRLFKNDYVQIVNFLKNVTLHTDEEKKDFFRDVIQKLLSLPEELVATRLVRPLLARFVLIDVTAVHFLIPHILTPRCEDDEPRYTPENICPLIPESLFKKHVIPEIFKIFHVRDLHVRKILLRNFSSYVHLFDKKTLESFILPQILLGLRDSSDDLVQASLHAVADLVPLLGGDVVIGANRVRVFSEGMPKMMPRRANYPPNLTETMPLPRPSKDESIIDHKPKLKDLARQGNKEKREDTRRRAEERKRKKEEVKNKGQEMSKFGKTVNNHQENIKNTISTSGDEGNIILRDHSCDNSPAATLSEQDKGLEEWNEEYNQNAHIDHADTWSAASESIEDEIENELSVMESTLSDSQRSKVSSPERENMSVSSAYNVPVTAGSEDKWHSSQGMSNGNSGRKTSRMKLSDRKTKRSPSPSAKLDDDASWTDESGTSAKGTWDSQSGWNEDWSPSSSMDVNNQLTTKPNVSQTKTGTRKHKTLGSEFDIMALDIKTSKSTEFDFFADMQPDVKKSLESDVTDSDSKPSNKSGSSMFAAAENWEDTGGWGDDLEWATDDTVDDKS